ncbi:unnamed protein product [Ectocarpus sp. 12 AP-2014]
MMMNLLRDKSPNIQYEAFHVFKVFVANPKKPREVTKILVNNKAKLIAYLENFHNDRDDAQFKEEKKLLVSTLSLLQLEDAGSAGGAAAVAAVAVGAAAQGVTSAQPPRRHPLVAVAEARITVARRRQHRRRHWGGGEG